MASPTELLAPAVTRTDAARHRADFPILASQVHGHPLVYLDNAATSQKPRAVIRAVSEYYERDNANVHRSIHALSTRATEAYEAARATVARFLGAVDVREIVFVRGTTEAVNLVASSWGAGNLRPGDEILLSVMEHHSNLVPWQLAAQRQGCVLRFLDVTDRGTLALEGPGGLDDRLSSRTKLVALTPGCRASVSPMLGRISRVRSAASRTEMPPSASCARRRMPVTTISSLCSSCG